MSWNIDNFYGTGIYCNGFKQLLFYCDSYSKAMMIYKFKF